MALDALDLPPGATVAVTGAAGGYAVQLAKAAGLTVIADAAQKDRDLVIGFDADHVLARGDGFAEQVRDLYPHGADGIIDGAVMNDTVTAAVRDGGNIATVQASPGLRTVMCAAAPCSCSTGARGVPAAPALDDQPTQQGR